jgi:hypothetical protein
MPLKQLRLWRGHLSDLAFIHELPLEQLLLDCNPMSRDLSPPTGSKIVEIHLQAISFHDLAPQRGLAKSVGDQPHRCLPRSIRHPLPNLVV